jgi:light-regulated signal transduction histidine kinase (bacteriophytochrome)
MLFLSDEELKYRKLSEKLIEANAELENLNWIGSHDLKEPLRKIQLFASRIIEEGHEGTPDSVFNSVKKMSESAQRMQVLISDVLSYSRLSHVEDKFEAVFFGDLVKGVMDDLSFELNEKSAVIDFGDLPTVKGIPFLLQQLMVNLVRNALKFSKAGSAPHILISYNEAADLPAEFETTEPFYVIVISDNGIGFDSQHKETIFKVFQKLHNTNEYSGSGVGLALCRKIMKSHNGYITADGSPGVGTAISLYFPK